ncbi:hypothetical protein AX16_010807 [Volvariella volvacea WC 439]|nr:hypothetical protein AX16_010807 [Volvariella volvacea WC 439]
MAPQAVSTQPAQSTPNTDADQRPQRLDDLSISSVPWTKDNAVNVLRHVMKYTFDDENHRTSTNSQSPKYEDWVVDTDGSIFPHTGYQGVEIISPILFTHRNWEDSIHRLWDIIHQYFTVKHNDSCGMHIHTTPHTYEWDLDGAKRVAKMAVALDPFIDAILPATRRGSAWNQSSIYTPRMKHLLAVHQDGLQRACSEIDTLTDIPSLLRFISPTRNFAWNFRNMDGDGCKTIEFRRPPMASCKEDVFRWVEFCLAFLTASQNEDPSAKFKKFDMDGFEYFRQILKKHWPTLHRGHSIGTDAVFKGASYSRNMTREPDLGSDAQQELFRQKLNKESKIEKKFKDLLSRKPKNL